MKGTLGAGIGHSPLSPRLGPARRLRIRRSKFAVASSPLGFSDYCGFESVPRTEMPIGSCVSRGRTAVAYPLAYRYSFN